MFEMIAPFLCLGFFLSVMGGVVGLAALAQKRTKGYYFYNDEVFAQFWDLYAAEPSVALKNIDSTSQGGTLVSYKIRWMKLHVYINKIGVFYYSAVQYNQTYGSLLLFNQNDMDKYESRRKMPLHSYEFVDQDTLILHCQSPTPFGPGKGRLVLKGIPSHKMEKIRRLLRDHFDSLSQ